MFVELMPLLKDRTLLLTVARVDDKVKVNVIPAKKSEGEDQALTTPLSYTASAEELDADLGKLLVSYVSTHVELGNTLAQVKAEMEAAAKAARQKIKATQAPKAEANVAKKQDETTVDLAADAMPSLFATQPQTVEPPSPSSEQAKETP